MTTTPPSAAGSFAMSARILCGSLMAGLAIFGVVLFFVLGTEGTPPVWVPVAQVAAGVAVHVLLETIGYRIPALDTDLSDADARQAARVRWQSSTILRFALSETIAIVSVVGAFVLDGGLWTYVGGAVVSLLLMAVHVWPWARPVDRVATALESSGRQSHLREDFGVPAPGPIQQF